MRHKRASVLLAGAAIVGCSPTAPGIPDRTIITPPTASVSGVVLLNGAPLATGGKISYAHRFGVTGFASYGQVDVNPGDGSYEIKGLPFASAGTSVEAFFINVSGAAGNIHQPCATSATVTGDTILNVELFPLGILPADPSPLLSGVVFERDREGRQMPIRDAFLAFRDSASTRTDDQGRYRLCRMPSGTTTLLAGQWCNEFWMATTVAIQGDTVHDIDMTGWCPSRQ